MFLDNGQTVWHCGEVIRYLTIYAPYIIQYFTMHIKTCRVVVFWCIVVTIVSVIDVKELSNNNTKTLQNVKNDNSKKV